MLKFIYIGIGGFIGAISRFTISKWIKKLYPGSFPLGTLLVNLLGCFLLGIFMEKGFKNPYLKAGLTTGFLGALTTFSTFSYQSIQLLSQRELFLLALNLLANLFLGLLFVWLGILFSK